MSQTTIYNIIYMGQILGQLDADHPVNEAYHNNREDPQRDHCHVKAPAVRRENWPHNLRITVSYS